MILFDKINDIIVQNKLNVKSGDDIWQDNRLLCQG